MEIYYTVCGLFIIPFDGVLLYRLWIYGGWANV